MKRLLIGAAFAALLVSPPLSAAGPGPSDGTLSVRNGRGSVALNVRGTIVGRVARGTIRISDPFISDGSGFQTWGCDRGSRDASFDTPNPEDEVKICKGADLRFRAVGGRYLVSMRGTGIFLSVVGRGRGVLDGRGDEGIRDGIYSINGEPFQSLPDYPEPFSLAAPSVE